MRDLTLEEQLQEANESYWAGSPIMSDSVYDRKLEELKKESPNCAFLKQIGCEIKHKERKEKLPIQLYSLDKVKNQKDIEDWIRLNKIHPDTLLICTPKFDGISLLVDEENDKAWTRGDGVDGLNVQKHYFLLLKKMRSESNFYTHGEAIMSKHNFKKYVKEYATARNLVAGIFNQIIPNIDILKDISFIRYSLYKKDGSVQSKQYQLTTLNELNIQTCPRYVVQAKFLKERDLVQFYERWSMEYNIDGIVIDIDDVEERKRLGKSPNGNPNYSIAYKGNFAEVRQTVVSMIDWRVSKQGYIKPVLLIQPIELDGAMTTRVTAYNAKYILDNGIEEGTIVRVRRSGQVIPEVVEVVSKKRKSFNEKVLDKCPGCSSPLLDWSKSKVELICQNKYCQGRRLAHVVSFFDIVGVENFGEERIKKCFEKGFDDERKILNMTVENFEEIDGYAKKSAEQIWWGIRNKVIGISLSKLQHASGLYEGLGEKTLELINQYKFINRKEKYFNTSLLMEELYEIDGVSEITANAFLKGEKDFLNYLMNIDDFISIQFPQRKIVKSNKYEGWNVVFTGIRDRGLEKEIEEGGGKIGNGVNKITTYLIIKDLSTDSSKRKKAIELGIRTLTIENFKKLIKTVN